MEKAVENAVQGEDANFREQAAKAEKGSTKWVQQNIS
jgi:hypothetical protein